MAKVKAGSVESMVKWMVARGKDIAQIFGRISSMKGKPNMARVEKYIDKYAKAYGKNVLPTPIRELTERQRAELAKTGKTKGFYRATVDVTWISPGSRSVDAGTIVDGTWYVDVPDNLSGSQLADYVRNALYQRFNQEYGGSVATLSKVPSLIQSMQLRGLD